MHRPRTRDGKLALVDCPKVCRVSEFPAICASLGLFNRPPHRATVHRWVEQGKLPTTEQSGQVFILVHQYLQKMGLAY